MNRPARFTVADVRRAIRAAAQTGPDYAVEIAPDGTIRIVRRQDARPGSIASVEDVEEIVL